ncbi:MAG: type II toxin-antitoxin system RelE/ParE family toxin [Bacteroidales bacterium]|jgi:toxin ParE1/3/4|nr:type II toxin-antitoxin system RelE/ParE family toxin [Bacteroidales bacterium]MDN5350952.1 toxin ParE1/3/4 [Bacteroidales bacterium]
MNFKISQQANNILEEIWLYTFEDWILAQADRYINLILNEIDFIAENPRSGKDYSKVRKEYYCSSIKSHLVFYKINHCCPVK